MRRDDQIHRGDAEIRSGAKEIHRGGAAARGEEHEVHRGGAAARRDDDLDGLVTSVLDGAFAVHRELGPGLLESVYEACLCHELRKRGIPHRCQVMVPIRYDGTNIDAGLRLDLLVDERLIVELKAVESLAPIHTAQVLTYLKITGHHLGLIINFHVPHLRDGIRRVILSSNRRAAAPPR